MEGAARFQATLHAAQPVRRDRVRAVFAYL